MIMGRARGCSVVAVLVLHFIVLSAMINSEKGQHGFVLGCPKVEREALTKFKETASNISHRLSSSWKGEDCCHWHGVTCHNVTRHVVGIDLRPCYQYHGDFIILDICSIPSFDLELIFTTLDPSLLELKQLEYLDLSNNIFRLIQIPKFIGSMRNLRYLNLSYTGFFGVVPPELGNLTQLQVLDLYQTEDNSFLKTPNLKWISSLVNLKHLDLGGLNVTTRGLNPLQPLNSLTSLLYLGLSNLGLSNSQLSLFLYNSTFGSNIQYLDLSNNNLNGPFPLFLANLTSLKFLNLSSNQLNGSIPLWLSEMKTLEVLHLENNSFTHVEGGTIMGILGKLCHLKELHLGGNNLTLGTIGPSDDNFSRCVTYELEDLDLSYNSITAAAWPNWLGKLKSLKFLRLESVRFYDPIPPFIGNLTSLEELQLSDCGLIGSIPYFFRGLSSLKTLDLSFNALRGSIPLSLGELFSLKSLDLSSNFLEGSLSESQIANLSSLEKLDLSNNRFSGHFPTWFPHVKLQEINISHNHFKSIVPLFPPSSPLMYMDLSNNSFSGPLYHLCRLRSLLFLNLQRNQFSGPIPDCWDKLESLNFIDMSLNTLSGFIPKTFGQLSNLDYLSLNNNFLEGTIPTSLTNQKSQYLLEILDLGGNKLSGEVPKFNSSSHPNLVSLNIRANRLEGTIPSGLCWLRRLQNLDLAMNNLTGSIPLCFSHFLAMATKAEVFYIPLNQERKGCFSFKREHATVVWKGKILQYTTTLMYVVNIDLSCNGLVGSVPEGITNLSSLIGLNISYNNLNGIIPQKIGEMRSLESLDLSNNNLSGTIPTSLSAITSLSNLNLSSNKLHGEIPTGSQLQTFNDPSIYNNNAGLCGDPLPTKCVHEHGKEHQQDQGEEKQEDNEDKLEKVMFYVIVMLGFATGFWGVIISLLLKKTWRYAVFRRVEKIADFFYVQIIVVWINRLVKN